MAVKRRVIWMADEEWDLLRGIAQRRGESISGVIRDFWTVAAAEKRADVSPKGQALYPSFGVATDGTAEPVLDYTPTVRAFNTRPFTPVPKPGRR